MEEVLTLAELAKRAPDLREFSPARSSASSMEISPAAGVHKGQSQGHIKDTEKGAIVSSRPRPAASSTAAANPSEQSDRQQAIISILRTKGPSYIKDISMVIRDVSEKTIQRELQALVMSGAIQRQGDRRWTQYFLP